MYFESVDGQTIISALELASSQDPTLLKDGETKLSSYEKVPGYYPLLLSLVENQQLHPQVRLLSALILKNGIERHWRSIIQDAEKALIRKEIFKAASDPTFQLALQIAVIIGKIARVDIKKWPEIITSVLQAVKSPEVLMQHRSLLVLNHIIKALASKRLMTDRLLFKQVAEQIFGYVLEILTKNSSLLITQTEHEVLDKDSAGMTQTLELCMLITKVLKKLLVYGFKEFGKQSEPMLFLQFILHNIRPILKKRNCTNHTSNKERIEKFVIILMKVVLESQEKQPLSFVPVLADFLTFAMDVVFTDTLQDCSFDLLKVKCCNLIQRTIRCDCYRPKRGTEIVQEDSIYMEAFQIRLKLFTTSNLTEFIRRLCFQYFPLTHEELELWEMDPEAFASEETGESIAYMLRPSSESLFLALFYEFRGSVTPVLADLIRPINESGRTDPENFQSILEREAVYYAAGLASYELFDDLNFDDWFSGHLVKELEHNDPRLKFIRHRITWLIGRWINVKFSRENRVHLYRLLIHLLDSSEDLVVRITAARTLKTAIEDFEFKTRDFIPFLQDIFQLLLDLLIHTQECDTKLTILQVASSVVEKIGSLIQPYCHILVTYLPRIWSEATHHKMLQSAVITTLTHLVESFGEHSEELHSILFPVIRLSTDMQQEAHVHLLDDGLELWQALMKNAPQMTDNLLQLFAHMVPLLDRASENLRICMAVTESYLILDAQTFLRIYSAQFVDMLRTLLGNVQLEGNIILARLMELVLILFPVEGATLLQPLLIKILGVILVNEEYPPLMAVYLSLFGYLIIQNPQAYMDIASTLGMQEGKSTDEITGAVIDVWLDKIDSMTKESRRKLTAVTMCSMLPSNSRVINERFALILDMIVNVLYDSTRVIDPQIGSSAKVEDQNDDGLQCKQTAEEKRRRLIKERDLILNIPLTDYVRMKLQETEATIGPKTFNDLMETLDSAVAKQLMSFVTAP